MKTRGAQTIRVSVYLVLDPEHTTKNPFRIKIRDDND